jgi:hypothetical protein
MSPSFESNSHIPDKLNILCHCHLMIHTCVHMNMAYKVLPISFQTLPMVATLTMEQDFAATKERYKLISVWPHLPSNKDVTCVEIC